ncbi:MAG: hypothetical protein H6643_08045 [Caldilineaceae bacterium]|nr:hypothetical protein [Caldilineaceae bacterium]
MHSSPGKGAAVKAGMLAAQGEYRFICDADLAMPIDEIAKFLPPALSRSSFDIAIASREIAGAVRYNEPTYRHIMGRVFNWLVRVLAVSGIQDTQCGFKMFTRETALAVFPAQRIDGWGFDVEVLYIAASAACAWWRCRSTGTTSPTAGCGLYTIRSTWCANCSRFAATVAAGSTRCPPPSPLPTNCLRCRLAGYSSTTRTSSTISAAQP